MTVLPAVIRMCKSGCKPHPQLIVCRARRTQGAQVTCSLPKVLFRVGSPKSCLTDVHRTPGTNKFSCQPVLEIMARLFCPCFSSFASHNSAFREVMEQVPVAISVWHSVAANQQAVMAYIYILLYIYDSYICLLSKLSFFLLMPDAAC